MSFRAVDRARSGLELANAQLNSTAHNTANVLTEDFRRSRVNGAEGPDGGVTPRTVRETRPGADLVADAVDRTTASVLYRANLAVLVVDDRLTGETLDLIG